MAHFVRGRPSSAFTGPRREAVSSTWSHLGPEGPEVGHLPGSAKPPSGGLLALYGLRQYRGWHPLYRRGPETVDLTIRAHRGDIIPTMYAERKVSTAQFFADHPVFSLSEAVEALAPPGGRRGAVERLKYHVAAGRLRRVARETYAVVPPGIEPGRFQPDAFLVASTIRPDSVFSHHSALELLGAAHSTWNQVTVYAGRRRPLVLNGVTLRFLDHPGVLDSQNHLFATRRVEHRGRLLRTTGPERTLVEGFRRSELVGGLQELVVSAGGFPVLDLEILEQLLTRYSVRKLWAATGWFLEHFKEAFHVQDDYLQRLQRFRPEAPSYLLRSDRGGTLVRRWNLILPEELSRMNAPDER